MTTTSSFRSRAAAVAGVGAAGVLLALAAPAAAFAHVHVDATSTSAGSDSTLGFTIGHGCDGSPTTSVTIAIPDEIAAVSPIANPGWTLDLALDDATNRSITYTADTPLPSAVRDTIELGVTLPDDVDDVTVLAFPVEQTCEVGSTSWSALDESADAPAPMLVVGADASESAHGEGGHEHGTAAGDAAGAADATASDASASNGSGVQTPLSIAALVAAVAALVVSVLALRRQRPARD